jgi:hypothetical protein
MAEDLDHQSKPDPFHLVLRQSFFCTVVELGRARTIRLSPSAGTRAREKVGANTGPFSSRSRRVS